MTARDSFGLAVDDELLPAVPSRRERTLGDRLAPLRANKLAIIGGFISLIVFIMGAIGFVILGVGRFNHLYLDQNVNATLTLPFHNGHLLGTDNLGRDMGWRIIAGTGISLFAGLVVTALSIVVGTALGAVSGYVGGLIDRLICGLIDLTWGFPVILVAVIFVSALSPGLTAVIIAISVVNWAGFARIVRAEVLSLKERAFVEAARALGVPAWKIVLRHLMPNMIGTMLVMASYYVAVTVIAEAGLSFIGLGAQPPTPSLGQMIAQGQNYLYINPWAAILPGGMIAIIVLGLNTLGDGLRDIFDPHLRQW